MERLTEVREVNIYSGEKEQAHTYSHIDFVGDGYVGEAIDKLADYEDLEEQGLLLRLPCKVGSDVYIIMEVPDGNGGWKKVVKARKIEKYTDYFWLVEVEKYTVYMSEAEAEQALADKGV